jgi:hypothetical protein
MMLLLVCGYTKYAQRTEVTIRGTRCLSDFFDEELFRVFFVTSQSLS